MWRGRSPAEELSCAQHSPSLGSRGSGALGPPERVTDGRRVEFEVVEKGQNGAAAPCDDVCGVVHRAIVAQARASRWPQQQPSTTEVIRVLVGGEERATALEVARVAQGTDQSEEGQVSCVMDRRCSVT